jgi:hypothetical protein
MNNKYKKIIQEIIAWIITIIVILITFLALN